MLPSDYSSRPFRHTGEIPKSGFGPSSVDADMLGLWNEQDRHMSEMASTSMDKQFLEEAHHVEKWFRILSETERTATIYMLLQQSSQTQARFFIHLLQPMSKHSLRTLAQGASVAEAELASALAFNTGVSMSRPLVESSRRAIDRHSIALGDSGDYNRLLDDFIGSGSGSGSSGNGPLVPISSGASNYTGNSLLEDVASLGSGPSLMPRNSLADIAPGRTNQFGNRPRSVIEGDLFSTWRAMIPPMPSLGSQSKAERPKSEILPAWSFDRPNIPGTVPEGEAQDTVEPTVSRPTAAVSPNVMGSRPTSPNTRSSLLVPPGMEKQLGLLDYVHENGERGYASDHSETSNASTAGGPRRASAVAAMPSTSRAAKDKKAVEVVDMELLKDIPAWFRSLRLHKYNGIFESMTWKDIIKLNDQQLEDKGVAALGARRKMLKVFENIRAHCDDNGIHY